MMGIASKSIKLNSLNYNSCGWYMYLANGILYSQDGKSNSGYYNSSCYQANSIIGIEWDETTGSVTYFINGKNCGIAYSNIKGDYYPAFNFYQTGTSFELVQPNW